MIVKIQCTAWSTFKYHQEYVYPHFTNKQTNTRLQSCAWHDWTGGAVRRQSGQQGAITVFLTAQIGWKALLPNQPSSKFFTHKPFLQLSSNGLRYYRYYAFTAIRTQTVKSWNGICRCDQWTRGTVSTRDHGASSRREAQTVINHHFPASC